LWLIFAGLKRELNLEKSCHSGDEFCERIDSRRAAADLEKFQARREMDCPIQIGSRKIMFGASVIRSAQSVRGSKNLRDLGNAATNFAS
jgi:hypothetical protein